MEFLKSIQADLMVFLTGVCGIMALFVHLTETMSKTRKKALMLLEISAMFLMIADRHAYISRGDVSTMGWWMVRVSNFMAFFLTLLAVYALSSETAEGRQGTGAGGNGTGSHLAVHRPLLYF